MSFKLKKLVVFLKIIVYNLYIIQKKEKGSFPLLSDILVAHVLDFLCSAKASVIEVTTYMCHYFEKRWKNISGTTFKEAFDET